MNKTDFSRVVAVPHGVEAPTPSAKIADWFKLHSAGKPQPALGHLDSGSNRTTRDVNARDRSVRPPPHCAESTQRKRHTAGAEGEGAHYGPRPTHQAHRDTTAAYRNHPQRDYPHREHIATLQDRRCLDYEKRRVFSPQDGSSSARERGGRGIVTPDGRWDYRLRQHPVEGSTSPHPRRMIEAHQPMEGSSGAHGGDRAPSPVQKPSQSLQLQQRGNYNDDLPVDLPPRTACHPRLHWLISRDWLVGFDPTSSQLFRPSRVFSHTSRIRQILAMRAQFNKLFA